MVQDCGSLPEVSGIAKVLDVLKCGISRRPELNKLNIASEGVYYSLEAFLIPLLVTNRVTATHAAALNHDSPFRPGGARFFLLTEYKVRPDRYGIGDPRSRAQFGYNVPCGWFAAIIVSERRVMRSLEFSAPDAGVSSTDGDR
jgi:hypothetical protein